MQPQRQQGQPATPGLTPRAAPSMNIRTGNPMILRTLRSTLRWRRSGPRCMRDGLSEYSLGLTGHWACASTVAITVAARNKNPDENPYPGSGSPVYASGFRSPFGMAFRPSTGALYLTENSWHQQDEVNIVVPGGDYGWPVAMGIANNPEFIDPIIEYTPSIAPTEADFYTGEVYTDEYRGNFFFGDFITGSFRRVVLGEDAQILFREGLLAGEHGPILDVVTGPDGLLYFSTPTAIYRITSLGR